MKVLLETFLFIVGYNSLMLAEMLLLGFLARKLYKKPLPEADEPKKGSLGVINPVCVVSSNRINTIGVIMSSENNNDTEIGNKNQNREKCENSRC